MTVGTKRKRTARWAIRKGATVTDYVLLVAIIIPLIAFVFGIVPGMIRLVYDMTIVIVNSPVG
jgi:hypothetical protein